ncbi:MAG: hypothetical protein K2Q22_17910, partial [Cytophagales bacterium]|nr:hypothetical protein [Cytophagales bacterium]
LSPLVRNTRLGLLLGHELIVTNKLTMIGQFGFFTYNPFKVDADSKGFGIYQRLGLRYLINKHIFVAWYLKTFYARADNWELTLGYRF